MMINFIVDIIEDVDMILLVGFNLEEVYLVIGV